MNPVKNGYFSCQH